MAYLFNEVRFTRSRINGMLATEATIMHTVVASIWVGKNEYLNTLLEKLGDGE